MTERDRLIELLKTVDNMRLMRRGFSECADYLLKNGVIVPPCKEGDKLYIVANVSKEIVESVVIGMWIADGVFSLLSIHGTIITDSFGKTIFLTKEEAEKALKEREQG